MPMVSSLSQLQLATLTIAIAAGGTAFGHVNDSGCWMCQEVFNVDVSQYLKYVSPLAALGGIVGMILLMALSFMGLI